MSTPLHAKYATACYVAICRDSPGSAEKRASVKDAHMRYIEKVLAEINVAGPLYDDGGARMIGSVFILRTQDEQRARELVESDPMFLAEVWESIQVAPFLPAAGTYIGGTTW